MAAAYSFSSQNIHPWNRKALCRRRWTGNCHGRRRQTAEAVNQVLTDISSEPDIKRHKIPHRCRWVHPDGYQHRLKQQSQVPDILSESGHQWWQAHRLMQIRQKHSLRCWLRYIRKRRQNCPPPVPDKNKDPEPDNRRSGKSRAHLPLEITFLLYKRQVYHPLFLQRIKSDRPCRSKYVLPRTPGVRAYNPESVPVKITGS